MSLYERIATSSPVNRTAAVVTSGGNSDPDLTPEQMRQNLLPILSMIEAQIKICTDKALKKELGLRKLAIQDRIRKLRGERHALRGFPSHFVEAARDMLPPALFRLVGAEAAKRARDAEQT